MRKRRYLVTGSSSGIGESIVQRLLAAGHEVTGIVRRSQGRENRGNMVWVECDLSQTESLDRRLQQIASSCWPLDGILLCAGAGDFGSLEEFSAARIRHLIDLNLTSAIYLAKEFLPRMKRRGEGDLVMVGSEAALKGGRRGAVYSATKFGLRGLAQSLREECAGSGVRVSLVNPGMVDTPFFDALDFAPGDSPDNYIRPADVAEVVMTILNMPQGTVIDEVNMSPLKKVIRSKR